MATSSMPSCFAAGETVEFTVERSDCPASDGWAVTVYLNGRSTASQAGVPSGDEFNVTLSATTTAALIAGSYAAIARFSKSGVKKDLRLGTITVTPDIATAGAEAFLSYEEKTLAIIQAAQNGTLTKEQESYTIDGIAVVHVMHDLDKLERLRVMYEFRVARKRGAASMRVTKVSFGGGY